MTEKTQITTERTRDFSRFVILPFNRKVDESRVEKLMESIKRHGFLMPILVSQNMEVADGQHRLEAAKKLNVEVSYIKYDIDSEHLPILIGEINSSMKNWAKLDYFNMWLIQNKPVFLWISEMIEKYKLSFHEFDRLSGLHTAAQGAKFKDGSIELTESQKERIVKYCEIFDEIINFNINFSNFTTPFRMAIIDVIKNSDYDHKNMMIKLEDYGGSLLNCINKTDFIMQIESIYNRGNGKKQVQFLKRRK